MKSKVKKFLHAPIKFMGHVYQKKYHMRYVHARKLFVFDIVLLLGTIFLIACTVFWKTYDPTVLKYIDLSISVTDQSGTPLEKIASGEVVSYTIEFKNSSEVDLKEGTLRVLLPEHFALESLVRGDATIPATTTIHIGDIAPTATGFVTLSGVYYGIPDEYEDIRAILSYQQDGRVVFEQKQARLISALREAVLETSIVAPETIRGNSTIPVSITLRNTGERPLQSIIVPTQSSLGAIVWETRLATTSEGLILSELLPLASSTLQGTLVTSIPIGTNDATLSLIPALQIGNTVVSQSITSQILNVVHPSVSIIDVAWESEALQPGSLATLRVNYANTGDTALSQTVLELPLNANIVAQGATAKANNATLNANGVLIIPIEDIGLGASGSTDIAVQLRSVPTGGTDITLAVTPAIRAAAPGGTAPLRANKVSSPLRVGTTLSMHAESRYYTNEGDQLGRGLLPPQVGKETKYWALITIKNTSSRVRNMTLRAPLSAEATWTGKSSVTAGADISFDPSTRVASWSLSSVPAGETIGVYMELAVTPSETMLGTVPTLLTGIRLTGEDTYIEEDLILTSGQVTADLAQDTKGANKGTLVR